MGLSDKLKKTVTATTTTITGDQEGNRKPPKGAEIIREEVRTKTEEIMNGWLVTKNHNGRYKLKDSKDSYGEYFDYDEKWYSKEDPLTITVNDRALADAFDEED